MTLTHLSSLSLENLWNVVKKIKLSTTLDKTCAMDGIYNYHGHILSQVKKVEEKLQIQSSEIKSPNMTSKHLNAAASMLIYLSTCPGVDTASVHVYRFEKWFKRWKIFFKKLFETKSPDHMMLTLNRLTKNNLQKYEKDKINIQKIFKKAASMFNLEFETIHQILPGKGKYIHFQDRSRFDNKSGRSLFF